MANIVVVLVVALAVFLFVRKDGGRKTDQKKYLRALARYLRVEIADGEEEVSRIQFDYKGQTFLYEHLEDAGMHGRISHRAVLKGRTPSDLTLGFSERVRKTLRSSSNETLQDVVDNPWGGTADQVPLPKALQDFEVHTNQAVKAAQLLADEQILGVFLKFKYRDSVGHPRMPLEIIGGEVVLHFAPAGEPSPNVTNIQYNVGSIEDYASQLLPLLEKLRGGGGPGAGA